MSRSGAQTIGQWIDTLRMSDQDFQELVEELDGQSSDEAAVQSHRASRYQYTRDRFVLLEVIHSTGSVGRFLVRPFDLSKTGISIMHGVFVYDGTPCRIRLRNGEGKVAVLEGKVVRCRYVRRNIHDIGIQFIEPVEIDDFIDDMRISLDQLSAREHVAPARILGLVLCVDPSMDDRELLVHDLGRLDVAAVGVENGDQAVKLVKAKSYDLVFVADRLAGTSPGELMVRLRTEGYKGRFIAVCAEEEDTEAGRLLSGGFAQVMYKPCRRDDLSQLLFQYLPVQAACPLDLITADPFSSRWDEAELRPRIVGFLERAIDCMDLIVAALADNSGTKNFDRAIGKLRTSAKGYGFEQIVESIDDLLARFEGNVSEKAVHCRLCKLSHLIRTAEDAAKSSIGTIV